MLLADERVLVIGQGVFEGQLGLVALTDHRLLLLSVGFASTRRFEEFALTSVASLEYSRSPDGERLVIHGAGGMREIKQLFRGKAEELVRRFHERTSVAGAASVQARARTRGAAPRAAPVTTLSELRSGPPAATSRDIFISHASEDKEPIARPLAGALSARGWKVWLDEHELTVGDSLNGQINDALATSRFGIVVLSPAFCAMESRRY